MKIQTARRACVALCVLAIAPQAAFGQCSRLFAFSDSAVCSANKPEVLDLAPGASSTECGRGLRCPVHPCITVTLPGDDASCARLEAKVNASEMLSRRYEPPCAISVAGKPFGRVYDADDKSRHFKFNTSAGTVDYVLSGKNAAQRVPIPPAASRCVPRPAKWECSGFGEDLMCYQAGSRYDNGPTIIKFDKRGDPGVCLDLATTLQQTPSLLSVAACLVPPPKPIPPAIAQGVKEAEAKGKCPGTWNLPFVEAYQECLVNYTGTGDSFADCCDIIRKRAQEKNGKGITIFGREYFKGNTGGDGTAGNKPD